MAGGWAMVPILICSAVALAIVLERCWTLRRKSVLPPGLGDDLETVSPFASGDTGLPLAIAPIEHQDRFAGGKPQHIAEIVALARLQRDHLARRQRGIDKQPWLAKIELGHGQPSSTGAF